MIISRPIHVAADGIISLSLWLSNILVECMYVYTCVCVYIYHLFIHSSVDKHAGCFHVLATINSAAALGCMLPFFPNVNALHKT